MKPCGTLAARLRVGWSLRLLAAALLIGCESGDNQGHTPAWVVQEFIEGDERRAWGIGSREGSLQSAVVPCAG